MMYPILNSFTTSLCCFVCFFNALHFTRVLAQCEEVVSLDDPSLSTCASLHLYKDTTYSERILSATIPKNDWIFGGVVTQISRNQVEFMSCWVTANETGNTYSVLEEGCVSERTYGVNRATDYFHKVFGKFLQFSTDEETTFRLICDVTVDCPVVSGCHALCDRQPPRMFRLSSDYIVATATTGGGSSESGGGFSGDNLMILLISLAAAFFLIFLIVLIIVLCGCAKKRNRRRQAQKSPPEPVDSSGNSTEQF